LREKDLVQHCAPNLKRIEEILKSGVDEKKSEVILLKVL
jgi:hypothetical protein